MAEENDGTTDTQDVTPTGDAPGQQSGKAVTFTPEQQTLVDKIIGDRLAGAKTKWESAAQAALKKEQDEAETERLKEREEFKALAEKANVRVAELEPQAEKAQAYAETLTKLLEAKRKGLPEHITALLDAVGDPLKQLTWLEKNAEKLTTPPAPNIDGDKQGEGNKGEMDEAERQRISRLYGL